MAKARKKPQEATEADVEPEAKQEEVAADLPQEATEADVEPEVPSTFDVIVKTVNPRCSLNVRSAPSKGDDANISRGIPSGQKVTVLEDLGDWYRIGDGEYILARLTVKI